MNNRLPAVLPPLDIAETDDVPFDYSTALLAGEAIELASITVTLERGQADPDAAALAQGAHAIGRLDGQAFVLDAAGPVVLQRFTAVGRPARNLYCVRCVARLDSGRVLTLAAHIAVRRL